MISQSSMLFMHQRHRQYFASLYFFFCSGIMLWCCLVLSVDRINGFCVVDKSLRFLNTIYPWHWIKVYIDLGYCNPTHFQTRGPKVQKLMFLLFVHRELLIPPATSCRGVYWFHHVRPSVHPSVHLSILPSVCPSVDKSYSSNIFYCPKTWQ